MCLWRLSGCLRDDERCGAEPRDVTQPLAADMQSHAVCVRRCGGSLLDRVQCLIEIYEVDHVGFVSQSREYVVAVSSGPDKWT